MLTSADVCLTLLEPDVPASTVGSPPAGLPLAGLRLRASHAIPGLPALQPGGVAPFGASPDLAFGSGAPLPGCPLQAVLGDVATELTCHASSRGITVRATGFGEVFVSATGRHLTWRPGDDAARQRPELILGPGLILALAFHGTFCLHASGVLSPDGAVLFAGDSGAGKSTLAARLSAQHGLPRLTDDITPFHADASGCFVLPHFPQLKLPPEGQHPGDASQRYRVARLFLIAECDPGSPARVETVSPSVAALAVCRHSVATRLFTGPLTAGLLHASAALAESVQVRRLFYPKSPGSIADVARLASEP